MNREEHALSKVRETFAALEQYGSRLATIEVPPTGSELACDDTTWPKLPLSELTRGCLITAWDHLDLVKLTIDRARTFPTGLNGVLRGAMVGSAQALWLLGPESAELRRERHLALAQEWYFRRIQYQEGVLEDVNPRSQEGAKRQVSLLKGHLEEVAAKRQTKLQVQPTSIIQWASELRFGKGPLSRQAVNEFRRLGGDAHAIGWQLLLQEVAWQEDGVNGGLTEARVTARFSNLAEAYLCSWHLLTAAFDRFDVLASRPAADSVLPRLNIAEDA